MIRMFHSFWIEICAHAVATTHERWRMVLREPNFWKIRLHLWFSIVCWYFSADWSKNISWLTQKWSLPANLAPTRFPQTKSVLASGFHFIWTAQGLLTAMVVWQHFINYLGARERKRAMKKESDSTHSFIHSSYSCENWIASNNAESSILREEQRRKRIGQRQAVSQGYGLNGLFPGLALSYAEV